MLAGSADDVCFPLRQTARARVALTSHFKGSGGSWWSDGEWLVTASTDRRINAYVFALHRAGSATALQFTARMDCVWFVEDVVLVGDCIVVLV